MSTSSLASAATEGSIAPITIALVGAPNCGKTALFNVLTGSKAKVANYLLIKARSGFWICQALIA